jgi:hypothetical protein
MKAKDAKPGMMLIVSLGRVATVVGEHLYIRTAHPQGASTVVYVGTRRVKQATGDPVLRHFFLINEQLVNENGRIFRYFEKYSPVLEVVAKVYANSGCTFNVRETKAVYGIAQASYEAGHAAGLEERAK